MFPNLLVHSQPRPHICCVSVQRSKNNPNAAAEPLGGAIRESISGWRGDIEGVGFGCWDDTKLGGQCCSLFPWEYSYGEVMRFS